jgi:hypothetical protein
MHPVTGGMMAKALAATLLAAMGSPGCSDADGSLADSSAGPDGAGASPAGPVALRNLSARLTSKYGCPLDGSTFQACGDYRFTFVLHNSTGAAIQRMDQLELRGAALRASNGMGCPTAPWLAASNSDTPVIDVEFKYIDGINKLVIKYPCALGTSWAADSAAPVAAPYSGSVTVRVAGILTDATPWTAEASTVLVDGT